MGITRNTFHDAVEHLRDVSGGIGQDSNLTLFRRAVRAAYRDLVTKAEWDYFRGQYHFFFNEAYGSGDASDATLIFDLTGGASERICTISAGTVPSWAEFAGLRLAANNYDVDLRLGNTTFSLKSDNCPAADVAATTNWQLYRDTYPLPDDFVSFETLYEEGNFFSNAFIRPNDWMLLQSQGWAASPPFAWTIMANPERGGAGKYVIRVIGFPSEDRRCTMLYRRRAREPVLSGLEANSTVGTIAATATSRAIVGTVTQFSQAMVGAILRWNDATNEPTGNDGLYPFVEEHRIESVTDATHLTLETPAVTAATGVKYRVSDLLDADQAMTNALIAGCEYFLATYGKDQDIVPAKLGQYQQSLLEALAQQNHNAAQETAQRRGGIGWDLDVPYPRVGT